MIAFHGDENLKKMMVEELLKHQEADTIIKGTYGEKRQGKWRGCAVGCSIKSLNVRLKKRYNTGDHRVYEEVLGIPKILAKTEDAIFERLPDEYFKEFPLRFIQAIPVGADLSGVWDKFAYWLLTDKEHGVINLVENKKPIQDVIDLYDRKLKGETIDQDEWIQAARNAWDKYNDAYASASASAYASAYASASAYAYVYAYASASAKLIVAHMEKLLSLLEEALVPTLNK